jgi:hypothetical protein
MSNKDEFNMYKDWCKERGLKPNQATSLEAYMKEKKTTKK